MEIKDALSIYTVLGQLGLIGSILFSLLFTLVAAYLAITVAEKITTRKKSAKWLAIIVSVVIAFCMITLSVQSNIRKDRIDKANSIKAFMLSERRNWKGFREIARNANLSIEELALRNADEKKFNDRVEEIQNILSYFPEEFEIAEINNGDPLDKLGVELIDTSGARYLHDYFEALIPLVAAKIKDYFRNHSGTEMLTYQNIRDWIDNRFQDYVLDMTVARYTNIFIPVNIGPKGYWGIKYVDESKPSQSSSSH